MVDARRLSDLHPRAAAVAGELVARGVVGPFAQFPATTKSAREAADAIGCDLEDIASCLVFLADGEPVVVVKGGARRLDLTELARVLEVATIERASADQVRVATGQAIGGVSPVGWPASLRVIIDQRLRDRAEVWAACGTPNAVFRTSFDELVSLTTARVSELAFEG